MVKHCLEQAAERGIGFSILGGIKDTNGHGPRHPVLAGHSLSRGLGTR